MSRPASPIPPYEDEDEECIVVDDSDVNNDNDNEGNCPNLNEIMTKEELEMVAAIMEDLPPEVAELMMVDDDAGLNNRAAPAREEGCPQRFGHFFGRKVIPAIIK